MLRSQDKRLHLGPLSEVMPGLSLTPLDRYIAAVLADSPRAFWPFQEASGLPQDISGNGLHMTTSVGVGKTYGSSGPFEGAVGIVQPGGQYFERSHVSTVTNNFTVEMWFKFEAAGGGDRIFYNGNGGANGWGIDMNNGGPKFRALLGGVAFLADAATSINTGAWFHIAMVRESGTMKYYVGGALDTGNAGTNAPNAPNGVCRIGSDAQIQGVSALIAVYEAALGSADFLAHIEAATG